MNLHKVYAIVITIVVVIGGIAGVAAVQHFKDDARRDAVIDAQKSDISKLEQGIADVKKATEAEIAALEKQKQTIISSPAQAPTIIREVIPQLQQTQPLTKETLPDAPSATLSKQDEQQLAQYIVGCKQCQLEREQLQQEVGDQQQIIERQKTELDASLKAAKGGSVWQRTKRIAKWVAIAGGTGYVIGRVQR